MKHFLNSKTLKTYCVLYTLLTIAVNVYCIIRGSDYAGLWHDIDRAIVLYLVMLAVVLLMHMDFKKKLIDLLLYFLPLLFSILTYLYLLYLRGIIALDLLVKAGLGALILYVAAAILGSVWTSLKNTSKSMLSSRSLKSLRFDLSAFLLLLLILAPMIIWHVINGHDNALGHLLDTKIYIVIVIIFIFMALLLLLNNKKDSKITAASYILLILYYICFILCFFAVVNVFVVETMQVLALAALIVYEVHNKRYYPLVLTIIIMMLAFYGCLSYFGY